MPTGVLDWHAIIVITIVTLGTVFNILAFRVMSCPSMTFLNAYFYLKGDIILLFVRWYKARCDQQG